MDFKKWVKSIQTAGYNGARTVYQGERRETKYVLKGNQNHRFVLIGKVKRMWCRDSFRYLYGCKTNHSTDPQNFRAVL